MATKGVASMIPKTVKTIATRRWFECMTGDLPSGSRQPAGRRVSEGTILHPNPTRMTAFQQLAMKTGRVETLMLSVEP